MNELPYSEGIVGPATGSRPCQLPNITMVKDGVCVRVRTCVCLDVLMTSELTFPNLVPYLSVFQPQDGDFAERSLMSDR